MNYKITHSTTYTYGEPVAVCHNQVLLTPRDRPGMQCRSHRLTIRPTPSSTSRRFDFFGNHVHSFSIEEVHRQLTISATCRVSIVAAEPIDRMATPPWEEIVRIVYQQEAHDWIEAWPLLFESTKIDLTESYAAYARHSFTPGRPILDALLSLTNRIHLDFRYDKMATHVGTSTAEAFRIRRGVCQDFAHVQIACLRSIGIPARYVSGYLRTVPPPGQERLVGADQSHAWLGVYCGALGWIDVDPTNDMLTGADHVPLAYGRDYHDVAPIRGVFLGGGKHTIKVSVDVCPIDG